MKRKALAAIMAVAMAVSMAGCGGSTSESKDSTQKTETEILRHQRAEA